MKVYAVGKQVKMIGTNFKGHICGVCMSGNQVEYRIRYIDNGKPESVWLWDFEVEPENSKPIGFGSKNNNPLLITNE